MLMMGLKQWTLWSSWCIKQFLFFMVSVIIICILVKVSDHFQSNSVFKSLLAVWTNISHEWLSLVALVFWYFHPFNDLLLFLLQVINFKPCNKLRYIIHVVEDCIMTDNTAVTRTTCSVWFNSARVGLIVGFVVWFVNYFPFLFIPQNYSRLNL